MSIGLLLLLDRGVLDYDCSLDLLVGTAPSKAWSSIGFPILAGLGCRKSTAGFNIGQMILDLVGGILSLFQLALEAVVLKDASLITGLDLSEKPSPKLVAKVFIICWDLHFRDA